MDINCLKILELQPSQFYLSGEKIAAIERWFNPQDMSGFEPVPVKLLDGRPVLTDGHTRAFVAWRAGLERIPMTWDEDALDWDAYRIDVAACARRGVFSVADMAGRILDADEYDLRWRGWCDAMHETLEILRTGGVFGCGGIQWA